MDDLISVRDLERRDFEEIHAIADLYASGSRKNNLHGTVALAFFEPSTRTATSFETAAKLLGMNVVGFRSEEGTSVSKGETLGDTVRMLDGYSDCIVMRHRFDGAAKFASEIARHPIINAGDGKNEHPTQAILDLYTIRRVFGGIDGLTVGVLGDLRYSRTVNSLLLALNKFKPKKVYLISPPQLTLRKEIDDELEYSREVTEDLVSIIQEIDVLYVTRIQKERFPDEYEYEKVKGSYKVDHRVVSKMRKRSIILHPLPRVDEIDRAIDSSPKAKYFYQASLGVPVRMAIFERILGERK